jgi:hypothetical protein
MRIEPTAKNMGIGSASPAQTDTSKPGPAPAGADHIHLSALSRAASGLAPAYLEGIRSEVSSGTYQANAGEVSRRIVDFYLIPLK